MRRILLLTSALVLLLPVRSLATPARAAGFTVTSPLDAPDASPGDGICATATGACTLRAAVQEANATPAPDTITLGPGVYALGVLGRGEDAAATGDLDLTRSLTITGAGVGSTIVDGSGTDRIFHVIGPIAVQLTGLTLRNGNVPRPADISADGGGGAIYVVGGASLALSNVGVQGNVATSGAVAIDDGGSLTAMGATFTGNTASFGAAVFTNGTATLSNTTISGNTSSSSGGGIYARQGTLSVVNSTIAGNSAASATLGGGGLLVAAGVHATVMSSTLSGNSATNGGGVHSRGSLTLVNSTLSANTARSGGGGLFVGGGSASLSNATLSANSADAQGGGILNAGGTVTARNTIVANSPSGGTCGGQVTSAGSNLDGGQTCGFAGPGDLAGVNPQLGPLQNNGGTTVTHALPPFSAAIDAGNACEPLDQRGQRRPTDGNGDGIARCDIGAFEAPAISAPLGVPFPMNAPATLLPAATATPPATMSPAVPPPPAAPARSPVTATPISATVRSQPADAGAMETTPWVLLLEPTEAVSVGDADLGSLAAGAWYVVIAEEAGWLLVACDPTWPFWIRADERVEVYRN